MFNLTDKNIMKGNGQIMSLYKQTTDLVSDNDSVGQSDLLEHTCSIPTFSNPIIDLLSSYIDPLINPLVDQSLCLRQNEYRQKLIEIFEQDNARQKSIMLSNGEPKIITEINSINNKPYDRMNDFVMSDGYEKRIVGRIIKDVEPGSKPDQFSGQRLLAGENIITFNPLQTNRNLIKNLRKNFKYIFDMEPEFLRSNTSLLEKRLRLELLIHMLKQNMGKKINIRTILGETYYSKYDPYKEISIDTIDYAGSLTKVEIYMYDYQSGNKLALKNDFVTNYLNHIDRSIHNLFVPTDRIVCEVGNDVIGFSRQTVVTYTPPGGNIEYNKIITKNNIDSEYVNRNQIAELLNYTVEKELKEEADIPVKFNSTCVLDKIMYGLDTELVDNTTQIQLKKFDLDGNETILSKNAPKIFDGTLVVKIEPEFTVRYKCFVNETTKDKNFCYMIPLTTEQYNLVKCYVSNRAQIFNSKSIQELEYDQEYENEPEYQERINIYMNKYLKYKEKYLKLKKQSSNN